MDSLKTNPLVVASVIFLTLLAVAAIFVYVRHDAGPAPTSAARNEQKSQAMDGAFIGCSNGEDVRASAKWTGAKVEIVGELVSFNEGSFALDTPAGRMDLVLATDADVGSQFLIGDWVAVDGVRVGERLTATAVRQPCSDTPVGPALQGGEIPAAPETIDRSRRANANPVVTPAPLTVAPVAQPAVQTEPTPVEIQATPQPTAPPVTEEPAATATPPAPSPPPETGASDP